MLNCFSFYCSHSRTLDRSESIKCIYLPIESQWQNITLADHNIRNEATHVTLSDYKVDVKMKCGNRNVKATIKIVRVAFSVCCVWIEGRKALSCASMECLRLAGTMTSSITVHSTQTILTNTLIKNTFCFDPDVNLWVSSVPFRPLADTNRIKARNCFDFGTCSHS